MANGDGCSASEYNAADTASSSDFSNASSSNSSHQGCPSLATHFPCDIKDVVLFESPCRKRLYVKKEDGSWSYETVETSARKVSIKGSLGAPRSSIFDVLGDKINVDPQTSINIEVDVFATGEPGVHPAIEWKGPPYIKPGIDVHKTGVALVEHCSFPVWRKPYDTTAAEGAGHGFLEKYWPFGAGVNEWSLSVETCGTRAHGTGKAVGSHNFTIRVFPADQYKLTAKFPAWREHSRAKKGGVGYQRGSGIVLSQSSSTTTPEGKKETKVDRPLNEPWKQQTTEKREREGEGGKFKSEVKSEDYGEGREMSGSFEPEKAFDASELEIEFAHDEDTPKGASVETFKKGAKVISKIRHFAEMWNEIVKILKDLSPPSLWSYEGKIEILSGEVGVAWGYKECEDGRIRFRIAHQTELVAVSASITIKLGYTAPADALELTLDFSLSGDIKIGCDGEFLYEPNGCRFKGFEKLEGTGGEIKPSGNVKVEVYGKARLALPFCEPREAKAGFETGFEVVGTLTIESNKPTTISGSIKFKAVVFYTYVENGARGKKRKDYQLCKEKPMGSFKFPTEAAETHESEGE